MAAEIVTSVSVILAAMTYFWWNIRCQHLYTQTLLARNQQLMLETVQGLDHKLTDLLKVPK